MSAYTIISHEYCDADAFPAENTTALSLEPNQFHKLCPGALLSENDGTHAPLGQPRCGDGTNYSFLFTRPEEQLPQEDEEDEIKIKEPQGDKILIELAGGGACWNDLTCALQSGWLTYPNYYNTIRGTSCADYDHFLCSKTVAGVDFTTYNFISIPYCTQDVHLGDASNVTYGETTIQHVGAHNIHRTLEWMFDNFANPTHIFVTGCSAGATPLPVVYDLINQHYTERGHAVDIDVMSDSPVFLTPSYFLENSMPNWNHATIMGMIGFNFDEYKDKEVLPDEILHHTLERSKKSSDTMTIITHDADQISISYYSLMKGGLFGRERLLELREDSNPMSKRVGDETTASNIHQHQRMENDLQVEWWGKMNNSMSAAMKRHSNFDSFVMEGSGHCTFGLVRRLLYVSSVSADLLCDSLCGSVYWLCRMYR